MLAGRANGYWASCRATNAGLDAYDRGFPGRQRAIREPRRNPAAKCKSRGLPGPPDNALTLDTSIG